MCVCVCDFIGFLYSTNSFCGMLHCKIFSSLSKQRYLNSNEYIIEITNEHKPRATWQNDRKYPDGMSVMILDFNLSMQESFSFYPKYIYIWQISNEYKLLIRSDSF